MIAIELPRTKDISVGLDKGYLRLSWSKRIADTFYDGKRYKPLKRRREDAGSIEWVIRLINTIQADIDHPDGLFDPSLVKYLGIEKVAKQFKETIQRRINDFSKTPESPNYKELFDEWADYLVGIGRITENTRIVLYHRYQMIIKKWNNESINQQTALEIINYLINKEKNKINNKRLLGCLDRMSQWAIKQGKLKENFFIDNDKILKKKEIKLDLDEAENDTRAFTLNEMNLIIQAYYDSPYQSRRKYAEFVEFLFLTGSRPCEALALKWSDIRLKTCKLLFHESYSLATGITTKNTKTKIDRIFTWKKDSRLDKLLKRLADNNADLVFLRTSSGDFGKSWYGRDKDWNHRSDCRIGIVEELVDKGLIKQYLKPYATRHTFITLMAQEIAKKHELNAHQFMSALSKIGDLVGNNVDTLVKHYLDLNSDIELPDIF